ncbi:CDP-glycerol glycerophosphotransferase family protein [Virgibacillus pantothenticus]|uniref:CDP-glycerol glycerophosphotransferase family protein n=1 Tax=Virgibacillus pantothenticus TaxID=1473 RepID=UPI0009869576|nr:CDP-glycerol glycerophosphotransferase family protein [Virgibacillus pantothenticus]
MKYNFSSSFSFIVKEKKIYYTDLSKGKEKEKEIPRNGKLILCLTNLEDQVLSIIDDNTILYVKNRNIILDTTENNKKLFEIQIENYLDENLKFEIKNKIVLTVSYKEDVFFELADFFTNKQSIKRIVVDANLFSECEFPKRERTVKMARIQFGSYIGYIYLDRFLNEIIFEKVNFSIKFLHPKLNIELEDAKTVRLENKINFDEAKLNISNFSLKAKPLKNFQPVEEIRDKNIICLFTYKRKNYYIYNQSNGIYYLRSNAKKVSLYKSFLVPFKFRNNFYLAGRFKHNGYKAKHEYDQIYFQNYDNHIGQFERPFRHLKVLNQLAVAKLPISEVTKLNRIHTNLLCGNKSFVLHNISLNSYSKPMKTFLASKFRNELIVLRNNKNKHLAITSIPFTPEYKTRNKLKARIARVIAKLIPKKQNINLYFEKKSQRAEESAIKVFDKVHQSDKLKSKNYFILDNRSVDFKPLKLIYGKNLIAKYSFRHFLKIFQSDYFISSELPNHLLNDRVYLDALRKKLMSTPSIFLQHGIMFAKPVDNPMAFGFHKGINQYNNIKNVISSDLEAGEFYKMGYDDNDLMKTGLATFDNAELDVDANKISFMPTYRYWEERLIYSNDITKTTYYKSIMKVISAFEEHNLLDRLLIVPHNKFSDYIYNNLEKYKHIVEPNPSTALKKSKIFITDYSSAIYDAIYRGAYPIFYWEEKEYLIENYKAIPPVNEDNAPGPVAKSSKELLHYVKKAISMDYKLEDYFMKKYLKINEFNDDKNTDRIINYLYSSKIL